MDRMDRMEEWIEEWMENSSRPSVVQIQVHRNTQSLFSGFSISSLTDFSV